MVQQGLMDDGTAIGMGLANAITRLKDSKAKSKVIILLTDGSNNAGDISPQTAAEIAKSFGIRPFALFACLFLLLELLLRETILKKIP